MSLPSNAVFFKENKVVGIGFCNIGWNVEPKRILGCIYDGWMNAAAHFTPIDPENEWYEQSLKQRDRDSKYFITKTDLEGFDQVLVYDYLIPRDHAEGVHLKRITETEFVEQLGQYRLTHEQEKELHRKIKNE